MRASRHKQGTEREEGLQPIPCYKSRARVGVLGLSKAEGLGLWTDFRFPGYTIELEAKRLGFRVYGSWA